MSLDEVELQYEEDEDNILINKRKGQIGSRYERLKLEEERELKLLLQKFMEITIENQKILSNMVRSNESLREDLAVLIGKVDRLFDKFEDFVEVVKAAAEEDSEEHLAHQIVKNTFDPFVQKFEEFSKNLQESNQMMLEVLTSIDKRIKRLQHGSSWNTQESLKDRMMQLLTSKQINASTPQSSVTSTERSLNINMK